MTIRKVFTLLFHQDLSCEIPKDYFIRIIFLVCTNLSAGTSSPKNKFREVMKEKAPTFIGADIYSLEFRFDWTSGNDSQLQFRESSSEVESQFSISSGPVP
ncbi:MAG: hypothetical protein K9M95_11710 [Candidatus Cloacimonetes bacterium]|nr:hypothetical protein [Candidatus Cloacimonadota bacterium]MCF7884795.1 hypothetical protein [Candidatus Cloacimonadota bacterium]